MLNGEQTRNMRRFAGSCRFVFNKALALQKERSEQDEKKLGYAELCRRLTEWRNGKETPWLKDSPTHPLQQTLKDLGRAYTNFFAKRADFPRFKKEGQSASFRYPDPKQIKLDQANNRIFLPKLGWLRYRKSRGVLRTVKNATISLSSGKRFVACRPNVRSASRCRRPAVRSASTWGLRASPRSPTSFHAPLNSFRRHCAERSKR